MALMRGVDRRDELDLRQVMRDARPLSVRAAAALGNPKTFGMTMAGIGIAAFALPILAPPLGVIGCLVWLHFRQRRTPLPLRVPMHMNLPDPTNKGKPGEGILFLGNDRGDYANQEECWISDSDARTHALVLGTTGAGKSEFLMSLAFNAIAWGSGFIYVDGKADNSLPFKIYSLCKRMGREDDFLVINFITGDVEAFARDRDDVRLSNTINVFSDGSSETWTQMVSSLMAEAGGDNAMWKGLAVGMINAVLKGLSYKKYRYGLPVDAGVIRDHIELGKLIELTREFANDPEVNKDLVFKPLQAYLLNLPGFDWAKNLEQGEAVSEDTKKQHDFRSMQFMRQLAMLADTYGSIFRHRLPEVDLLDVVLNRRILVVMIPSLEKSAEESEGLGKLLVSALKLMMSLTLGSHIEGMYQDAVESKVTSAPAPYICVLDELGYYFTPGLAVMFAQARSLGFMMVAAGQDLPAMMKGKNKEEAESVIANTKYKISLAMEDPERTADLIIKTASDAAVTETSGYSGRAGMTVSYADMMNASVQKRQRVTLQELRDLDSGQGILLWRDRVVRFTAFYLFGTAKTIRKIPMRVNRLIKLFEPSLTAIEGISESKSAVENERQARMFAMLNGEVLPSYTSERSPFIKAFQQAWADLPRETRAAKDTEAAVYAQTVKLWRAFVEEGAAAGGTGDAQVAPEVACDTNEAPAPEVLDVSTFLEGADAFVVAKKSDVERDEMLAALTPAAPAGDAPTSSDEVATAGPQRTNVDWVDVALASDSPAERGDEGGGLVMEKSAAQMLALMDGALNGGAEVTPAESASTAAGRIMDALAYDAPTEPTTRDNVDKKVAELRQLFEGF